MKGELFPFSDRKEVRRWEIVESRKFSEYRKFAGIQEVRGNTGSPKEYRGSIKTNSLPFKGRARVGMG